MRYLGATEVVLVLMWFRDSGEPLRMLESDGRMCRTDDSEALSRGRPNLKVYLCSSSACRKTPVPLTEGSRILDRWEGTEETGLQGRKKK